MPSFKAIVFISCGQHSQAERVLGKEICALLRDLRPDVEPYFAEDQSSVQGLSNHILKALHDAAGFICVMHRRGEIARPDGTTIVRGSVWIEQEIAIAAFMAHALNRAIQVFSYKEAEVGLEGIRSVLLMNPRIQFTHESEILADLRSALPVTAFTPFNDYDLQPVITHQLVSTGNGERHTYALLADVKNTGNQRITDFLLHVYFPRAFLNKNVTFAAADQQLNNHTHLCFNATAAERAPAGIYPGQGMKHPLSLEYFVDDDLFRNPEAMDSRIIVELYSGSMRPKKLELPIRAYQQF